MRPVSPSVNYHGKLPVPMFPRAHEKKLQVFPNLKPHKDPAPGPMDGPPLPEATRNTRLEPPPPKFRHGFWQPLDRAWGGMASMVQALWQGMCSVWVSLLILLRLTTAPRAGAPAGPKPYVMPTATPIPVAHTGPKPQPLTKPQGGFRDIEPLISATGLALLPMHPPHDILEHRLHNRKIYIEGLTDGTPYGHFLDRCGMAHLLGYQIRYVWHSKDGSRAHGPWEVFNHSPYPVGTAWGGRPPTPNPRGVLDLEMRPGQEVSMLFDGPLDGAAWLKTLKCAPHLATVPRARAPHILARRREPTTTLDGNLFLRHMHVMNAVRGHPRGYRIEQLRQQDSSTKGPLKASFNSAFLINTETTLLSGLGQEDLLLCGIADKDNTTIVKSQNPLGARSIFDVLVRGASCKTLRERHGREIKAACGDKDVRKSDSALLKFMLTYVIETMRRHVKNRLSRPEHEADIDGLVDNILRQARLVGVRHPQETFFSQPN